MVDPKMGAIYAYYSPDGRAMYVGSVQDENRVEYRRRQHITQRKGLIGPWLAQNKDKTPEIVEHVTFETVEQLFERENYWIKKLGTLESQGGLNRVFAGGPDHSTMGKLGGAIGGRIGGRKHKGMKRSETTRERIRQSWTPERRAAWAIKLKNIMATPERQERHKQSWTPQRRKAQAAFAATVMCSSQARENISKAWTDERRQKAAEFMREVQARPEVRDKVRLRHIGSKRTPESRERMRQAALRRWYG